MFLGLPLGDDMFTGLPLNDEWKSFFVKGLLGMLRMNQYRANWPIVLDALRRLWETGKVSEFKTPFFEPLKKRAKK